MKHITHSTPSPAARTHKHKVLSQQETVSQQSRASLNVSLPMQLFLAIVFLYLTAATTGGYNMCDDAICLNDNLLVCFA